MANSVKVKGYTASVILDGSTDLRMDTDFLVPFKATGLLLTSISFTPSGNSDVLIVRDAGNPSPPSTLSDAPELMHVTVVSSGGTADNRIIYSFDGHPVWPFIDVSECTFGTVANARIIFTFR